ncbi:MAG TPA: 30S ribosomal protein S16 [Gemmatimonadota bacterium]|nr:30S ribosomal protein S16 [Gemmatimonadota bacterium]
MPATIRLKRVGRKKQSAFRIVVADSSTAVEGPSIEKLGIYQPRTDPSVIELDAPRTLHWLRAGAKPTDTVRSLLQRAGLWEKFHAGVTPEELEQATILVGPTADRRQTSGRAPAAAAAKVRAAQEAEEAAAEAKAAEEAAEAAAEAEEAGAESGAEPAEESEPAEEPEAEAAEAEEVTEEEAEEAEDEAEEPEASAEDDEEEAGDEDEEKDEG